MEVFYDFRVFAFSSIFIPWEPKKLSSEVGPTQLMEYKVIKKVLNYFYIAFISFPEVGHLLKWKLMISRGGPPFKM